LAVLLAETTMLYARLAHSNRMLKRERANKLMSLEAMVAAIAHEVRQPLAAIVTNGAAGLRFLTWARPNVAEVRAALNNIVADGHRTSEVFDNLRALFGKGERRIERVDVSEAVRGAIGTLARELEEHDIMLRLDVSSELPPVMAHKGQLHELVINLVHNAIEAMATHVDTHRVLHVKTEERPDGKISLIIEDSGPGISVNMLDEIFEPFVSTKRQGMGLGLAICRMIVDSHQGELSVASAQPHGAIFRVVLPQTSSPLTSVIAASA
jgi:C4-dicarboxylate-specific signal transduction histidine kinase